MSGAETKSFDKPDQEFKQFDNADMYHVNVGGQRLVQIKLQPGWKWSECIKPIIKTESCQAKHIGIVQSGKIKLTHEDGSELEVEPGDAYIFEPGHDAWVLGDKPFVSLEFTPTYLGTK